MGLLKLINGCTFASLDAHTIPQPGLHKHTTNERVIMFTNKKSSGYENMVKRYLSRAGKNPESFQALDLPWGERVPDTPLILHKGVYYLQTIRLHEGTTVYTIGGKEIGAEHLKLRPRSNPVLVNAYKIENISRITLMGETVVGAISS